MKTIAIALGGLAFMAVAPGYLFSQGNHLEAVVLGIALAVVVVPVLVCMNALRRA